MQEVSTIGDFVNLDGDSEDAKLVNDIDFDGYTVDNDIINYSGNFYGQGFTIENFTCSNDGTQVLPQDAGLFGRLSGGVYNLYIDNLEAVGFYSSNDFNREKSYGGAVAANASGARIHNVHVRNSFIHSKSFRMTPDENAIGIGSGGGLSGRGGEITRCSVADSTIRSRTETSGFVSFKGSVTDSYAVRNSVEINRGPDGGDNYDPDWNAAGVGVVRSGDIDADNVFISNTFSGQGSYTTFAGMGISKQQNDGGSMNGYFNNDHGYDAIKNTSTGDLGGDAIGISEADMKGNEASDNMSNLNFNDVYFVRDGDFPQIQSSFSESTLIFLSGNPVVILPENNSLVDVVNRSDPPAGFFTKEGYPVTKGEDPVPRNIHNEYPETPL